MTDTVDLTTTSVQSTRSGHAEGEAPLLEVRNLSVRYEPKLHRPLTAVEDVSFTIRQGEFVGLIGESGSGKSTLANALLRLLERPGRISDGQILFEGKDITTASVDELRPYRWRDISTVFQSSMNALNPVVRVVDQFRDAIELHSSLRGNQVVDRVKELFDMVMIDHRFISRFPHELSGGMKQRVNLALALANDPKFVLLDEPTTGLDVVVQHNILENVRKLQREQRFAVLFISHDMGTVMDLSDRIMVMYAGRLVEEHETADLLRNPLHPYSKGLLGSYGDPRAETVRITYVPGRPPDLSLPHTGCLFAPRCPEKVDLCTTDEPPLDQIGDARVACFVASAQHGVRDVEGVTKGEASRKFAGPEFVKTVEQTKEALQAEPFLEVKNLTKVYESRQGFKTVETLAVDDVSFTLRRGMVTALVGQSGSGKTTLAKMITGVEKPTSGEIVFHSKNGPIRVDQLKTRQLRDYRQFVQMVFQDPYSSLNPTKTLEYILSRPLRNFGKMSGGDAKKKVDELLEGVALTPPSRFRQRFPYELSGGQRQRVVIARALSVTPELVVADEPISSLDVSIRAEILELLHELVQGTDVGILYITHDLLSARMLADEVIVLNGGKVVEHGEALQVIRNPEDEYTKTLLDAIPNPFAEHAS